MTTKIIPEVEAPVFCKGCGRQNSWRRDPKNDVKTEAGTILWFGYCCSVCGATTIVSALGGD